MRSLSAGTVLVTGSSRTLAAVAPAFLHASIMRCLTVARLFLMSLNAVLR